MVISPLLLPVLGSLATASIITTLVFVIAFAVVLAQASLTICISAIVAAVAGVLALSMTVVLTYRHARGTHYGSIQPGPRKRQPELTAIVCGLYMVVAVVTFALLQARTGHVPKRMLGASFSAILAAAFAVWATSLLVQSVFLAFAIYRGHCGRQQALSLHTEEQRHSAAEMHETSLRQSIISRGTDTVNSPMSDDAFSGGRKRSESETISSLRNSLTQVVRPITSKTRLISLKSSIRSPSLDSGTGEREMTDDAFDSWDTSAVDMRQQWIVSSNSSPTPGRFLETIPASPTGSRSPSPGCPLDLQPPMSAGSRRRSRSHSPAPSFRDSQRYSRAASPAESEAHIHPLFRTDSPEPPPSVTPGTVVTAAPGAGQVIPSRKSLNRMRSGSLPTSSSPLAHSKSMDDVRKETDGEESGKLSPPEREMTPPIPDWILGAGPRTSLNGYSKRKVATGLKAVGEVSER